MGHIDVLRAAGVAFDRAFLTGGGSRSPHWPKIFAVCVGVPISVAEAQVTGASGRHRADDANGPVIGPDSAQAPHNDKRYQSYLQLTAALLDF